jgi:hypothetical protein
MGVPSPFFPVLLANLIHLHKISVADPDSMGSQAPDPDSQSGPGSRRAKMTHKKRKKLINFIFWSAACSLLRAEGFSYSLEVFYGGLGLQSFIKKYNFFSDVPVFFCHQKYGSGSRFNESGSAILYKI